MLSLLTRANLVGRPLTNIRPTSSPLTPTTRREFTVPRGEPREKSIINKGKRRRRARFDDKRSGSSSAFRAASSSRFSSIELASLLEARPDRRLGSCFKISSLLFLVLLALFLLLRLWRYTQAIIQYSP